MVLPKNTRLTVGWRVEWGGPAGLGGGVAGARRGWWWCGAGPPDGMSGKGT